MKSRGGGRVLSLAPANRLNFRQTFHIELKATKTVGAGAVAAGCMEADLTLCGPQKRPFGFVCTMVGKSWLVYSDHCASIQTLIAFHL